MRVIGLAAELLPVLTASPEPTGPLLPVQSPAFVWAARWLQASGIVSSAGATAIGPAPAIAGREGDGHAY